MKNIIYSMVILLSLCREICSAPEDKQKILLIVSVDTFGKAIDVEIKQSSGSCEIDQQVLEMFKEITFPQEVWAQQSIMEVEAE